MLNCRRATELLSEAQDHKLEWRQRLSLRMHTMLCSSCRNFGRQLGDLRDYSSLFAGQSDEKDEK